MKPSRKVIWITGASLAVLAVLFTVMSLTRPEPVPLQFLSNARRTMFQQDILMSRGFRETYFEYHTFILDQPRIELEALIKEEMVQKKWRALSTLPNELNYLSHDSRLQVVFVTPSGPAYFHFWNHRDPSFIDRMKVWFHKFGKKEPTK